MTEFDNWVDEAVNIYKLTAFNLVGAPSSKMNYNGLPLHEAGARMKSRGLAGFGCVCIPERHISKGNEHLNMFRKAEFGAEWFITQGVFSAAPVSKLINEYGDICRENGVVPKKVVLTFAPCGRKKTMDFIKWLGMFVPEHKEKRILNAVSPVKESVILLREILLCILLQTGNSGVPLGINVESLSIFKDEIDSAHDLFQLLQVRLIDYFLFVIFCTVFEVAVIIYYLFDVILFYQLHNWYYNYCSSNINRNHFFFYCTCYRPPY